VNNEGYLAQLIAYVHLNPVTAGIADRPKKYRWSGHRDIFGIRKNPIISVSSVRTWQVGVEREKSSGFVNSSVLSGSNDMV
jgi:hypothetical protein